MNHHDLKIHPEHYNNVKDGTKTFEIRENDRGFQKGDTVSLYYYHRGEQYAQIDCFTSDDRPILNFTIGDVYPISETKVVFSLLPMESK